MPSPELVMAVTDFTKAPEQILVDLINFANGTALTSDLLTFGTPVPITDTHNTQLVITAAPGAYYTGSVTLTYNRVDIATVPGVRSITFTINAQTRLAEIIPLINAAYQINLTPADYIDVPLPIFDPYGLNDHAPVDVVAAPGSLVFHNRLVLNIVPAQIPLSAVILNTVLPGLIYLQPA